jgi:hypothetical protein
MRITVDLRGHNDWAPAPPGTVITEGDVAALRAKQMSDDSWHMKIEVERDTHFEMGLHEESICRQICGAYLKGEERTRAEIVAQEVRGVIKHHAARKHMIAIHVHDDGVDTDLMARMLEEYRITDPATATSAAPNSAASALLSMYAAAEDIGESLSASLRIKHNKVPSTHGWSERAKAAHAAHAQTKVKE